MPTHNEKAEDMHIL